MTVLETEEDIRELQTLMDRTMEATTEHHRRIVRPERRLSARQVCAYYHGMKHVAFATVSARGEPRVAPLDAFFVRGRFITGTNAESARARNIMRNPAVSVVHFVGDDVAISVHGTAHLIERHDEEAAEHDRIWTDHYGTSPFSWGERVVLIRTEPHAMWAYAQRPEDFP